MCTPVKTIFAVLSLFAVACTSRFDELNVPQDRINADNLEGSQLGQLFAQAQYAAMAGQYQIGQNLYADIYAQYFATTHQNFDSDQFFEVGRWTNGWFNNFYSSPAVQLFFVEQYTSETEPLPLENAFAKIWRVQMYHRVSDYFGPIMYSEFGNQQTSVPYDSQEAVYTDFFQTLDEAVAVLEQHRGENAFGAHDQMYGGDVDQWRIFANSLRLRLAMRIAYADPELARQEAEKAVADGVMTNNADNAGVLSTENSINNLSQWTYIDEFRMSASMESVLVGYEDPRLPVYFNEAGGRLGGDGGYHGLRNGLPAAQKGAFLNAAHSYVDTKWLPIVDGGASLPSRVISAAEVYFLRAEGALRGWDMGGTAGELYNEGIRTSLEEWDVPASAIDDYISNTNTPAPVDDNWNSPPMTDIPVLYQESEDFETRLEQIITQKWISMYPDGREAWAERRRTGYPRGYAIINSLNPRVPVDQLMRRLRFTQDELINNTTAVEEAKNMLDGPDENDTRLWWDAKPLDQFPAPTD